VLQLALINCAKAANTIILLTVLLTSQRNCLSITIKLGTVKNSEHEITLWEVGDYCALARSSRAGRSAANAKARLKNKLA